MAGRWNLDRSRHRPHPLNIASVDTRGPTLFHPRRIDSAGRASGKRSVEVPGETHFKREGRRGGSREAQSPRAIGCDCGGRRRGCLRSPKTFVVRARRRDVDVLWSRQPALFKRIREGVVLGRRGRRDVLVPRSCATTTRDVEGGSTTWRARGGSRARKSIDLLADPDIVKSEQLVMKWSDRYVLTLRKTEKR